MRLFLNYLHRQPKDKKDSKCGQSIKASITKKRVNGDLIEG